MTPRDELKEPAERSRTKKGPREKAAHRPIARVLLLLTVSHLDRPFDYLVDSELDDQAQAGVRVRVRFGGRLIDGYIVERRDTTDHVGELSFLDRVVSPLPVLTPAVLALAHQVAARCAGTRADVLRLAVPPRHARVEKDFLTAVDSAGTNGAAARRRPLAYGQVDWSAYQHGEAFIAALRAARVEAGQAPRAVWQCAPGDCWATRCAELATQVSGGVLIIVPDQKDLERVMTACDLARVRAVALAAGLGPTARYRRWLDIWSGQERVVIGTRSAVFAPVVDLSLIVVWDDGDELLAEPRAPYPHARDVAALRAFEEHAACVVGGYARTAEAQVLVDSGWAHDLVASRDYVRRSMPKISASGDSDTALARDPMACYSRLPSAGFAMVRAALAADKPVLVQVPRRGYVPRTACAACGNAAHCRQCGGPLELVESTHSGDAGATLRCRWCAAEELKYVCARCGHRRLRAQVTGAVRTAEELGRAFPSIPVVTSGGANVVTHVKAGKRLVIATPGAEPTVEGGYGAALLLDAFVMLARADLRVGEDTLRRWLNASALVRREGSVLVVGDPAEPAIQALIRWDPVNYARAQLLERSEVGFPPAVHMAAIDGSESAINEFVETLPTVDGGIALDAVDILGPVELPPHARPPAGGDIDSYRILLRVPRGSGRQLARTLGVAQAARAAKRTPGSLRVQIDPLRIG